MVSPKNSSIYFLSLNGNRSHWDRTFSDPAGEFVGYKPHEVVHVIDEVSKAVKRGYFAAGFISYEASKAFDPSIRGNEPDDFPAIWFRTFHTMGGRELGPSPAGDFFISPLEPEIPEEEYIEKVWNVRKLIAAGEVYQVNFTHRLRGRFEGSEESFFHQMCQVESAPYAAYIDCGRHVILSVSPELFFNCSERFIRVKPMKGTIPRGKDMTSDLRNRNTLAQSPKDRSENLMIVDLMRNDLGRISLPGTVHAETLFEVEQYETLYQMVSEISATLRTDVTIKEVMGALFPSGSVTGAPKIRSMQVIQELEDSPRNIYTGAIGYVTPHGEAAFNVAIRTAVIDRVTKRITYGTGGGIVYDSVPREEYLESEAKSFFIRKVHSSFKLLETILFEPGKGFFLLEDHLGRLEASAVYFRFPYKKTEVIEIVKESAGDHCVQPLKIRLLLDSEGSVEVDVSPLESKSAGNIQIARFYDIPVDEENIFLYHKTTARDFYNEALSRHPEVDELLFVNRKGEVTEGTRTNVVIRKKGASYTPPVESGLLPGTFRKKLLEEGIIIERKLSISDVMEADELFFVNSVRKWVRGKMIRGEPFNDLEGNPPFSRIVPG